ncbi:MAG: hypothetical protein UV61_C0014G0018 [Candidatus Gottesmanbacteria bacterium GW2011_GWB1_43_11]|uniref:Transposase IS200-like domain-containing protein n=1 Tax=Candidatus Gottesmanbacteria bacterium GW2011_GWB1_43_11 TaxID=1618446 RepID=A0A0G1FGE2_9BACT|nr:MAG: hypothetical protein UV04_C0041G0006 [Candidatus Gottesmanbacteria bacterium GW2011_GWA2_42_16]KKS53132.1 MAG: hypothetical protein UV17_C0040G0012 [Candidatus Gottesmanbacteria bacterium GW2011_GWA1_42_26]KKS81691.1 MAG: hypothetical protein UV55_C0010G0020 [Candidatus Gottesmanbacteria bacterium GW2011_GWC1_43_10]KKS85918.1 MAG: hypothetical protein UV61_C0014G0018 [Candidatus Gottesmanbacteria bacterium GW2011_GWB1_43_11]OGG25424.1 MAG: hypothetical protein A3A59_06570 [Candidatus Go
MPRRLTPFVSREYYHLFSRSSFRQPILVRRKDIVTFSNMLRYYIQVAPPARYSLYKLNPERHLLDERKLITVISYCHMPTHFHLCVRQEVDRGIHLFMRKLLNSYSHYYKIRYGTRGSLFESVFKAVHVETDEQLVHLTRYHHLNPVTAGIVKHPVDYPYSSYHTYINGPSDLVDTSVVLSHFRSSKEYERFVINQKDYQKKLDKIKHLLLA